MQMTTPRNLAQGFTIDGATPPFPVDQDSIDSIAISYGLDSPGIESQWGARFSAPIQNDPEAQPVSYTTGKGSSPGVKRPGCGTDHPPPN